VASGKIAPGVQAESGSALAETQPEVFVRCPICAAGVVNGFAAVGEELAGAPASQLESSASAIKNMRPSKRTVLRGSMLG
jgi:hypothetical protein